MFHVLTKSRYTTERRLMVDISAPGQAYPDLSIFDISLIRNEDNVVDVFTQRRNNGALRCIIFSGNAQYRGTQWVIPSNITLVFCRSLKSKTEQRWSRPYWHAGSSYSATRQLPDVLTMKIQGFLCQLKREDAQQEFSYTMRYTTILSEIKSDFIIGSLRNECERKEGWQAAWEVMEIKAYWNSNYIDIYALLSWIRQNTSTWWTINSSLYRAVCSLTGRDIPRVTNCFNYVIKQLIIN